MKAKVFTGSGASLENQINTWLSNNRDIAIDHIVMSQSGSTEMVTTVILFYH